MLLAISNAIRATALTAMVNLPPPPPPMRQGEFYDQEFYDQEFFTG